MSGWSAMDMDKQIDKDLYNYFSGKATVNGERIRAVYEGSDEMTRAVVRYRYSGGSYHKVQMDLYISQSCYYSRLKKFFDKLKTCKK